MNKCSLFVPEISDFTTLITYSFMTQTFGNDHSSNDGDHVTCSPLGTSSYVGRNFLYQQQSFINIILGLPGFANYSGNIVRYLYNNLGIIFKSSIPQSQYILPFSYLQIEFQQISTSIVVTSTSLWILSVLKWRHISSLSDQHQISINIQ